MSRHRICQRTSLQLWWSHYSPLSSVIVMESQGLPGKLAQVWTETEKRKNKHPSRNQGGKHQYWHCFTINNNSTQQLHSAIPTFLRGSVNINESILSTGMWSWILIAHSYKAFKNTPCEILRMGIVLSELWSWLKNEMMTLDIIGI